MKLFQYQITETLTRTIVVKARSHEEADKTIREKYCEGKIVLGPDDFEDYEIYSFEVDKKCVDPCCDIVKLSDL